MTEHTAFNCPLLNGDEEKAIMVRDLLEKACQVERVVRWVSQHKLVWVPIGVVAWTALVVGQAIASLVEKVLA